MGNCKDCRFWLQTGHRLGRCSKVTVTDDHWVVVRTHEEERKTITDEIFGCVYFEKKQPAPSCGTCRLWLKRFRGGMCVSLTRYNNREVLTVVDQGCTKWVSKDE